MRNVFIVLSIGLLICTLIPLAKKQAWWIRIFDFPQVHTAILILLCLAGFSFYFESDNFLDYVLVLALIACFGYLSYFIYPYTVMASPQVLRSTRYLVNNQISLFAANVFMENRESEPCVDLVKEKDPQVILLLETDQWWVDQMRVIHNEYPYRVTVPLDNTYGMALYSKLPLIDPEVKYLIQKDVPSVHSHIRLANGTVVTLHGLHPMPPSPTEEETSIPRDAELLLVAKSAGFNDRPTIVAGDLNDVAWSHTTRLFQRLSGLLDPRIGRGFFNTFNAKVPIFRWPLDHVFHSNDFKLLEMERLSDIKSDHFPIYIKLQFENEAEVHQDEPEANKEDHREATRKIQKGLDQ